MTNPVHKIKKLVKNPDGSSYWYEDTIHGWLSTGLKDKNGREIFEGDFIHDGKDFTVEVTFDEGIYWAGEDYLDNFLWNNNHNVEVVGHIAEDEK